MTAVAARTRLTWALLSALVAALFANQYLTVRKLRDLVIAETNTTPLDTVQAEALSLLAKNLLGALGVADYLLFAAIAGILASLVAIEWRSRCLTRFVDELDRSDRALYAFLALVGIIATRSYLNVGHAFMGDTEAHTLRSFMVAENLRAGNLPAWSNYWYGGYPLTGYYGPFYFLTTALLSIPLGDIQSATKLLLWATHMGSVFTMFAFLRAVTGHTLGSLVGTVGYTLSFHRLHILLYRGDLQLAVVFLLFPLLLWIIERYLQEGRHPKRTFLAFGLGLFVLVSTHHGYAFFGMVFLSIYIVVRALLAPVDWGTRIRQMTLLALSGIFGIVASVYTLVPFMTETEHVRGLGSAPFVILIPNYRAPAALVQMLRWMPVAGNRNIGYVGLSILLMAAFSVPFIVRRRLAPGIALIAGAFFSLTMMRNFVDYNVKNTNFFLIFACALAAFAPMAAEAASPRWKRLRGLAASRGTLFGATLALGALAAIAIDLGPLTFQNVYRDADLEKERVYAAILAMDGSHKVMQRRMLKHVPGGDRRALFEPGDIGVANAHTRIQSPLGRFHEGAGLSFGYNVELTKNVNRDLHDARISQESLQGLYLMGVKYIVFRDRFRYFHPELEHSAHYSVDGETLVLRDASPLVYSTSLTSLSDVPGFDADNLIDGQRYYDAQTYSYDDTHYRSAVLPLVSAMSVDVSTGRARTLVTRGPSPSRAPDGDDLRVTIRDFSVDIDSLRIDYEASARGYARLSYAYFPYLDVRVDGEPVEFWPSGMHQILLPIEPGEHVISIRGGASPLRATTFWFSLAVLAAGALLPARTLKAFEVPRG